jgi:short subunit dehydrogenase-like uncharacterized protein
MPWRSAVLGNPVEVDAMLAGVRTVVNTAGPFAHTAAGLMRACIRNGCHYLDLSNEGCTFQDAWSLDSEARRAGVAIVPGTGFGTAATEALAAHVLGRIPGPDTFSVVRSSSGGARTPGINRTKLDLLARRGAGIRDGKWTDLGYKMENFELPEGRCAAIPLATGDACAIARATGVRNVTAYAAIHMNPLLARAAVPAARRLISAVAARGGWPLHSRGKASLAANDRTQLWMQASNHRGGTATSMLQGGSGSELAARIALQGVQELARPATSGVFTAGQLIGTRNILTLPGIRITDL